MSNTYTKKEISRILSKASEIQASQDLDSDQEGLSEAELMHIAEEVGISKAAITEALQSVGEPDLDEQNYDLIKGTSIIQDVSTVKGDFDDEQWEEIVLEIRKLTGGIGKLNKTGKTYEWEQRKSDFGYKHFSFTPKDGQTKIQMVSSWGPFKMLTGFLGFFVAFIITLIAVKEISSKELALMIAPLVGSLGFAMSRFYLKTYFKKQKKQIAHISNTLAKKIRSFHTPEKHIHIEDEDVYQASKITGENKQSEKIS